MAVSDFDGLYQELLIEHSKQRHGFGLQPNASAEVQSLNRSCGDEVTLRLHFDDGQVKAVSWEGRGCAISQASASILSDIVKGLPAEECRACIGEFRSMLQNRSADSEPSEDLGDAVALKGVALYPPRIKCAMLAWVALEDALDKVGA
ncbi:MAG: SUF system NifU family Fe-S cluster assembly protein [Cryobacterium sp.]|nr:SUF system NifU family Fe-S cluster assembly protein [Cryobacterium sp.]